MKHLGDVTKIDGRAAPVVDVIIGGSPCQDLSVAGKREGLQGERSGLFMEQIRIIKEMRQQSEICADEFIRPRYFVWENVPGAFSSSGGEDFRVVLEEICRIKDKNAVVPRPAGEGKWGGQRLYLGRRLLRGLESSRRTVLGSPPTSPQNRTCRRFWRTIRTRNTFCPKKPVVEFFGVRRQEAKSFRGFSKRRWNGNRV